MSKNECLSGKRLAEYVAKRFEILNTLSANDNLRLSELAKKTEKDAGNLTRYLSELKKCGLIESMKRQQEGRGRPYNTYSLTKKAIAIMTPLIEETRKKPPSIQSWQIKTFLDMLNDQNLTASFRHFVAEKLQDMAIYDAACLLNEKKMRNLYKSLVKPSEETFESADKPLRKCLTLSIPAILEKEQSRRWFFKEIYPSLLHKLQISSEESAKRWAIESISRVARLTNDATVRDKILHELLELYFEDKTELASISKEELLKFEDLQKEIIEQARSESKNSERTEKAEALLKELISLWSERVRRNAIL